MRWKRMWNREVKSRGLRQGITQKIHLTGHHHTRLGTHLGSVWLRMVHRNVLMDHIQDQTKVEGVFPKHTVFVQCPMEKKCSGIGYCTPKAQIKCIVLHVSFLVELELLTHALW